ncbi:hypothetical protein [Aeromicrobium sp. UC242_57]|uniref:hypothetical protein n=1 Tax=Aeromicrobium sp. UC242_57 TaxID=3374624 RepID=UPI0037A71DD0
MQLRSLLVVEQSLVGRVILQLLGLLRQRCEVRDPELGVVRLAGVRAVHGGPQRRQGVIGDEAAEAVRHDDDPAVALR